MSAPAPDWLGAARAATEDLRVVLAAASTTAQRARETGTRGEGGDRTLEIDAAAEEAVFEQLERLHDDGLRFTAISEEYCEVADTPITMDHSASPVLSPAPAPPTPARQRDPYREPVGSKS